MSQEKESVFTDAMKDKLIADIEADEALAAQRDSLEGLVKAVAEGYTELVRMMSVHMPAELREERGLVMIVNPLVDGLSATIGTHIMAELDPEWLQQQKMRLIMEMLGGVLGGDSAALADVFAGLNGEVPEEEYHRVLH